MNREPYVHAVVPDFITEPICDPTDFPAPTCLGCQDNLSTKVIQCLKQDDFMTA
jgi:hypothetical protein